MLHIMGCDRVGYQMHVVTFHEIGGVFGPFDTKESAETYIKGAPYRGKVIEMIQPQSHNAAELKEK